MQLKGSFSPCHIHCNWDRPKGGDGSAQRWQCVIYDCLVSCQKINIEIFMLRSLEINAYELFWLF